MGMKIKYVGDSGTYNFDDDTTVVPISRSYTFDEQGRRDREQQTWQIRTILQAENGTDLDTESSELATKMVDGGLLTMDLPDDTSTIHELDNCRIQSLNYPKATGAEYARQRTVEVQIIGYLDIAKDDELVTFQESLSFTGGGSRYVLQETIAGRPVKHRTAQHTIFYVTQSGSATARDDFPTPPGPAFPGNELDANPDLTRNYTRTPEGELRYNLTWVYRFGSSIVMQGVPSAWA